MRWIHFVAVFLVLVVSASSRTCTPCHVSTERISSFRPLISSWLKEEDRLKWTGHVWLQAPDLKRFLQETSEKPQVESTTVFFYDSLNSVVSTLLASDTPTMRRQFLNLMGRGFQQVPVFRQAWEEGVKGMRLPASQLQAWLPHFQAMICRPFFQLYLREGGRYRYTGEGSTDVGKVFLLFSGYHFRVKQGVDLAICGDQNGDYLAKMEINSVYGQVPVSSLVSLSLTPQGKVESLSLLHGMGGPYINNLAGMWYRPGAMMKGRLLGDKTVWLPQNKYLGKSKIRLEMEIVPGVLQVMDGTPVLEVSYHLREAKGEDRGFIRLGGGGRAWVTPDGVFQRLETEVSFNIRLLGMNMVRGRSKQLFNLVGIDGSTEGTKGMPGSEN